LTGIIFCADKHPYIGFTCDTIFTGSRKKKVFKKKYMPELKLKQLQYEADTWKRMLGFMMEENIHLKNRISQILKDKFNENLLDEVEAFQSSFIKEDEMIGLLRNDLAELDKLLKREVFEDGMIIKNVETKLKKLRHNIKNAEKQFGKLKMDFNNYLSENI
jgi:regulator of replication initiation timing